MKKTGVKSPMNISSLRPHPPKGAEDPYKKSFSKRYKKEYNGNEY